MNPELSSLSVRRLPKGGTIALTALASPASASQVQSASVYLEKLGYRIVFGESLNPSQNYTSGTPAERALELMSFFEKDDVDAVFCIRGGFGTLQLLPFLDFSVFKENPKFLVGYSDITALQMAIYSRTGMPSVHGFMPGSDTQEGNADPFTEQHFWDLINSGKINFSWMNEESASKETCSGTLLGGNLSVFCKLIGSDYCAIPKNRILFFEDIGERIHKLEGYLWQLQYSGIAEKSNALLFGDFSPAESEEFDQIPPFAQIVKSTLSHYRGILSTKFPFGHIDEKIALPFGVKCSLSSGEFFSLTSEKSLFQH